MVMQETTPFIEITFKKTPKRCVRALSINPAASVKLRPLKQLVAHACALPCGLAGRILAPTFLVVFADNQQFKGGTSPLLRLSEELRRAATIVHQTWLSVAPLKSIYIT